MPSTDIDRLREENTELRRRIAVAQATIDELCVEALQRRAAVRRMAEELPVAISRHALLHQMLHDAAHHPDKLGVMSRALRKLARAPRKAIRVAFRKA